MHRGVFFHDTADNDSVVPSERSQRCPMVSKCSNSRCSASFLYLHSGKLFRFDTPNGKTGTDWDAPKPANRIEFFWLCEACATQFTMVTDANIGARLIALHTQARAATAAL
jgi:hypothetical protein